MRRRLILPALLIAVLVAGLAPAQPPSDPVATASREAAEAARRAARFRELASRAADEAARARAEAEALFADIERIEAEITAASVRSARIEALRARQRARLAERQQPLVRLTAALQTMARRPPALALVQPGSLDEIVRARAVLASTLPRVRERTAGLRAEAAAGDRLAAEAEREAAALTAGRKALQDRRLALARVEERQLRRAGALAVFALGESDRAIALDEEARAAAEAMRSEARRAALAARLGALPGPALRAGAADSAASRSGAYRLPVEGRVLAGAGELSDAGIHSRGLELATAAGAPVVAPRAGRIAYAGRFRSYGEVVIIDHGGGWTTTLTRLAALAVRPGDRVKAGDRVGRAGTHVGVELRLGSRPMPVTPYL